MDENVSLYQQMSLLPLSSDHLVSIGDWDDGEQEKYFIKISVSQWYKETLLLWYKKKKIMQNRENICHTTSTENSEFQTIWCPPDSSEAAALGGRPRTVVKGAPQWSAQSCVHSWKPTGLKKSTNARGQSKSNRAVMNSLFQSTGKAFSRKA